jgi:hypothetical protein
MAHCPGGPVALSDLLRADDQILLTDVEPFRREDRRHSTSSLGKTEQCPGAQVRCRSPTEYGSDVIPHTLTCVWIAHREPARAQEPSAVNLDDARCDEPFIEFVTKPLGNGPEDVLRLVADLLQECFERLVEDRVAEREGSAGVASRPRPSTAARPFAASSASKPPARAIGTAWLLASHLPSSVVTSGRNASEISMRPSLCRGAVHTMVVFPAPFGPRTPNTSS